LFEKNNDVVFWYSEEEQEGLCSILVGLKYCTEKTAEKKL